MKLDEIHGISGSEFSVSLKADNGINKLRKSPWLLYSLCLVQGNQICCGLLDDTKAINFKLPNDCCLARTRRASHNISFHNWLKMLLCTMSRLTGLSNRMRGSQFVKLVDLGRPQLTAEGGPVLACEWNYFTSRHNSAARHVCARGSWQMRLQAIGLHIMRELR